MSKLGDGKFRILSLDGGGAKGFYTLGVLHEVEAMLGRPLSETFDLIYGTSTGSIIGTMLALGCQSARKLDPISASNIDPLVAAIARSGSEPPHSAEPVRADWIDDRL